MALSDESIARPEQSKRALAHAPEDSGLRTFRLVIIDDSPDDRDLVRRFLLRYAEVRCVFLEADTGTKGVALCRHEGERAPHCVILDLHLPDMDGLDVIEELKDGAGELPFPILVLTGSEGAAHEGRSALKSGAQDYLGKSWITPESLSRAVDNAVERFRLTREVQRSEARLRQMADAMPQIVWISDSDGQVRYFNRRWYDYTGLSSEQTLGLGWLDAVHPDDREHCLNTWRAAVDGKIAYEVELRERRADGQYRWFLARALPVEGDNGNLTWFGTSTDIEDKRRQAEVLADQNRRLEESFALLDTLLKTTPIGLAFVDPELRFVHVNETLAATNGVPIAEHKGRLVADILPLLWPKLEPLYRQALSGRAVINCEVSGEVAPTFGQVRHWLCSHYPVRSGDRIFGVGVVVVEVTDQKRHTELLKEADRRKDEFLAVLAHELRNPLAPIRTGLELLKRAPRDPAVNANIREMMERALLQTVRLVDDLLDISRISTGKLQLRTERIELSGIVQTAVEISRPFIDEKRHNLIVALPAEPLPLDGDAARLAQVIANLLNNAAKYSPEGGQIGLSAARHGGEIQITVQDSGVGIAAADLPRVFNMFAQVESSLERSQGGLGIGLSLAKQLVEMHGGRIEAKSDGVGQGSEFIVYLPMMSAEAPAQIWSDAGMQTKVAGKRILIADDNRAGTDSLAMLLELDGHQTAKAYDGLQALTIAASFRPEIILLDIGMPRLNGYEVAQRLRAEAWGKNIVIIAMSGWGQDKDQQRARISGFDHHLIKPVNPRELAKLLAEV